MRVGFTGTRDGMTDEQRRAVIAWVGANPHEELHHGCCIGADEDMADIAASADDIWPGRKRPRVVAHPPTNRGLVCESAEWAADERRNPAEYLDRNHAIVGATDVLVVCPKGPEELRSGTWATARYARKLGNRVVIVWPDGRVEDSGEPAK